MARASPPSERVVAGGDGRGGGTVLAMLATLYLAGILTANATAAKLLHVGPFHVTTGALAIPLVYLTTDLINELFGAGVTRSVVLFGLLGNLVLVALSQLALLVPASDLGASQAAFSAVYATTPRIVFASMLAYLVSSLVDVSIFQRLRTWTGGRHFWLRKNGSTAVSQLLDTALFALVAFAGAVPARALAFMIAGQYLVKMAAAPLGTPLSYFVLARVQRRAREPTA